MLPYHSVLPRMATALAVVATVVVTGCEDQMALTQAATDPSDTCSSFRQTIANARNTEINEQAQGAIAGALVGAVLGAMVGGSGSNRRNAAIAGAIGGGLAGFSATYYQQLSARAQDANALLASVDADAGRELQLVSATGVASRNLRDCRSAQIAALAAEVRAGRLPAADARARLAVLRSQSETDNSIISAAFNGIGQRVDAYIDATATAAQIERDLVTTRSNPAAQRTQNVARVSKERREIQSEDSRTSARIDRELDALRVLLG